MKINAATMLALQLRAEFKTYAQIAFKAYSNVPFKLNWHHEAIISALEQVADGKIKKLMINLAPRHTKTELSVKLFSSWGFTLNPRAKFMHLSYSDTLVKNNSEAIKDIMSTPIYSQLFPASALRSKKQSNTEWYTAAGGGMYATSTQGQVTGFGAGLMDNDSPREVDPTDWDAAAGFLDTFEDTGSVFNGALIIDDPLKPEDAESPVKRNRVNERYDSTIRSRVNSRNTPIIITMQRVHENDLCGYLLKTEPGEWTVLNLPAILETKDTQQELVRQFAPTISPGEHIALWPDKMNLDELQSLRRKNAYVFDTQYQQDAKPRTGLLYEPFGEYLELPVLGRLKATLNYTDPADTGKDKLTSITYNTYENDPYMYVTGVVHTAEKAEYTEPKVVKMLDATFTTKAIFEGNGAGRLYARNIERTLREIGNYTTKVSVIHQRDNKLARMLSHAPRVNNLVKFPTGWQDKWPTFYQDLTGYRKDAGANAEDGAPDALTGCYEIQHVPDKKKRIRRVN